MQIYSYQLLILSTLSYRLNFIFGEANGDYTYQQFSSKTRPEFYSQKVGEFLFYQRVVK